MSSRPCPPDCSCGRHKSHTVTADGRRRIREAKHRQYSEVDFCGKRVPRERKEAVMATKPDVCELCGRPPKRLGLALDHDHSTCEPRGWLCHPCNRSLAQFGDDTTGLERALTYLTNPPLADV